MAITNSFAQFLLHLKKNKVSFENTLTLGRLRLYATVPGLNKIAKDMGLNLKFDSAHGNDYTEEFFKILGANKTDSLDYSDYESATILADLNEPLPSTMHKGYTAVLDSGTLEHVFNFPVAIASCMKAIKVGGVYIGITPANNMMGHGFYQFSPELYFRVFNQDNGFEVTEMLIGVMDDAGTEIEKWYEVKDPAEVKARVTLRNFKETYLFIAAKKIQEVELFKTNPFQNDYANAWDRSKKESAGEVSTARKLYKQNMPKQGQKVVGKLKGIFNKKKVFKDQSIGLIDLNHFKEVNFSTPADGSF